MNQAGWIPLKLLRSRFTANISALLTRYPQAAQQLIDLQPAEPYFIRSVGDRIHLAAGEVPRELPMTLPPDVAKGIVGKMFPEGKCDEASLIAGEDLGWLWNALYCMPCGRGSAPGYRPPLFFLMQNVERLWVILHIQDWQSMLADERVRFFIGENVVKRFEQSLHVEVMCPWPKLSVTVDPGIWPEGASLDTVITEARNRQSLDLLTLLDGLQMRKDKISPADLAKRIRAGAPLRIMGLTSRYTTFLQYSMRDWLSGLERLGHHTRLFIETFDHEVPNNLAIAKACAEYRPDIMIAIDHPRPALFGVMSEVPVVMWVQDRLPNIYDSKTGAMQGPMDYVIGYSRQELTQKFGYPASRFMPAMVGVNDERFVPRALTAAERERFGCDVSFVSHCVKPAEQIIAAEMAKQELPQGKALLDDLFQQLKAVYDSGGFVSAGYWLTKMIDDTLLRRGMTGSRDALITLFTHQVNNAMFRHQAIRWAAASGAKLHLYGNGWEQHPEFARYARGVADNHEQLPIIYQASAINLQITPFGAVHQRLLDGLAAGGFFLLRSVTADGQETLRRQMWEWCGANGARSGAEMLKKCDDALTTLLVRYQAIGGDDPRTEMDYLYAGLEEASMSDFQRTANTMWLESPAVTFDSQAELVGQIARFLKDPEERRRIAAGMRQRVLETHTYRAISKRMLDFIAGDLEKSRPISRAA
jgi:hypothetical protein